MCGGMQRGNFFQKRRLRRWNLWYNMGDLIRKEGIKCDAEEDLRLSGGKQFPPLLF